MRVFISADIEGICFTDEWKETRKDDPEYPKACAQMTAEVRAACEGAIEAGADYILVNDAHGHGTNIDVSQLPECVEVIRGWSGNPLAMADGVQEGHFDAAMFIGYHCAAGRQGSPLSHTNSLKPAKVRINGEIGSEFLIFSYAAAMYGVPTVFLSGDRCLCDDSADLHPMLKTVAVKEGWGGRVKCLHPKVACDRIREGVKEALGQDLGMAKIELPEWFRLEITYKEPVDAVRNSYYPGFVLENDNTIHTETESYMEILTAIEFLT